MFFLSLFLATLSLLTVLRAPAKPLWFVAIGVTEWGHYLALAAALLAAVQWRMRPRYTRALSFSCVAALLFSTPYVRALGAARDLPKQIFSVFGPITPRSHDPAFPRSTPLSVKALFQKISSPGVQVTQVKYADINGESLWMDVYRPLAKGAPLPGVIMVHGGSWTSGDRHELPDLNRYLAARGYVVVSIDYRLAPKAVFPAQRDDVFTAIAYLKNHARDLGLDRDRLCLIGRSAGGQIALSAAYAKRIDAIKSVIIFYTPNDLLWAYSIPSNPLIMNSQKVIETYLGGTPQQVPQVYKAASPLLLVDQQTIPTLMIHGARDELVWAQHDERLAKRLSEARRPFVYLYMPWATHGCDANFVGPCGQLSTYAIERFLAATLYETPEERMAQAYELHRRQS